MFTTNIIDNFLYKFILLKHLEIIRKHIQFYKMYLIIFKI